MRFYLPSWLAPPLPYASEIANERSAINQSRSTLTRATHALLAHRTSIVNNTYYVGNGKVFGVRLISRFETLARPSIRPTT